MKKNNRSAQRNLIMNSSLSRLGLSLLAGLLSPSLLAADLQKLDVAALPGDKVELKLTFDEPVLAPRGYTIEQPARIALDLPGISNKLGAKNRELGVGNARSVTVVEAKDRTRLIINLTSLAPYSTRVEGNHLYVVVGEGARTAAAAVQSAPVATAAPAKVYAPQGRAISNIDFQRGDQGQPVEALQSMLSLYGYTVEINGDYCAKTEGVVAAFQRHFRPVKVDGIADSSTIETLHRLLTSLPRFA